MRYTCAIFQINFKSLDALLLGFYSKHVLEFMRNNEIDSDLLFSKSRPMRAYSSADSGQLGHRSSGYLSTSLNYVLEPKQSR